VASAKDFSDLTETEIEKEVYASLPYREQVVDDIIANWDKHASGKNIGGVREKNVFSAVLAVSGKQAVVAYYNLFKKKAPHLKVAMTYSREENNQRGTTDLQISLKQAMKDYSEQYSLPSFVDRKDPEREYITDITKRLAHKKPYNFGREEERLDLIIVSDQLITGFDSKYVNMIYMDKLLQEGMLIQAMSRTNRTFDREAKPYGKVRFYRRGDKMQEYVENALIIYTHGGNETPKENGDGDGGDGRDLTGDDIIAKPIADDIHELNPKIERLKELAGDDFSQISRGEKAMEEFARLAVEVQSRVQRLEQRGYLFGTEAEEIGADNEPTGKTVTLGIANDDLFGALQARLNDVNEKLPPEKKYDLSEIKISLQYLTEEIIDYDKIVDLLNSMIDAVARHDDASVEEHDKAIQSETAQMDEESREDINDIVSDIKDGEITDKFKGREELNTVRKRKRNEKQKLKIRRWSDDHEVRGKLVLKAFDVYIPGKSLHDNPELRKAVDVIADDAELGFFEVGMLEDELLSFFEELV
jgi:type I restriction enzyme R subunit